MPLPSLLEPATAETLARLHNEAAASDSALGDGDDAAERFNTLVALERVDYRSVWKQLSGHYLAVPPEFGRMLYLLARAANAKRIVEFGASMGISAIYLASALRDNGGGKLITTEIEPSKAERAQANIDATGACAFVELRCGDALETLKDVVGPIDMILLDGSPSLYLPILRLLGPSLRQGAMIIGENAWDEAYLSFVRDPQNGYLSQALPFAERGSELSVRTG
jgi:predicted O-methyltransferase YrrM